MDSFDISKKSQALSVGVMPPDGTQLALSVWLEIFGLNEKDDSEAFVRQLTRDKIPHIKFCGTMVIDATHIRRVVYCGRGDGEKES